jgi:serine/threonine-protein kinase
MTSTAASVAGGERVGPYRILRAIGAGGSARVDLARLERAYGFERHVVVKRPLEHLRGDARTAAQLRREARIGGQLRHPGLVAVLDAGDHDGYPYLALEHVQGASLREAVQTDGGPRLRDVPPGVALGIAIAVARALHHAHELTADDGAPLGLVHRDVSPGNVLLGEDGAVKLADFGIAKETRVQTLSGSLRGTVTYMAPEQSRGHAYDRRADVFSLGVIAYELLTGHRLFWADNDVAALHRVLSSAIPAPRTVRPELPARLEEVLLTALAAAPQQRFATASDLACALEASARELGAQLTAREIARWVRGVLSPPALEAPRARPAAPPRGAAPGGSLVPLIASVEAELPERDAGAWGAADDATAPDARALGARGDAAARRPAPWAAPAAPARGDAGPAGAALGGARAAPAPGGRPAAPRPAPTATLRRRSGWIAAAIGAAVAGAIGAAVLSARDERGRAARPAAAPEAPAVAGPPAPVPAAPEAPAAAGPPAPAVAAPVPAAPVPTPATPSAGRADPGPADPRSPPAAAEDAVRDRGSGPPPAAPGRDRGAAPRRPRGPGERATARGAADRAASAPRGAAREPAPPPTPIPAPPAEARARPGARWNPSHLLPSDSASAEPPPAVPAAPDPPAPAARPPQ